MAEWGTHGPRLRRRCGGGGARRERVLVVVCRDAGVVAMLGCPWPGLCGAGCMWWCMHVVVKGCCAHAMLHSCHAALLHAGGGSTVGWESGESFAMLVAHGMWHLDSVCWNWVRLYSPEPWCRGVHGTAAEPFTFVLLLAEDMQAFPMNVEVHSLYQALAAVGLPTMKKKQCGGAYRHVCQSGQAMPGGHRLGM
eukprot:jgi/Ulvmu1/11136/UM071_0020.1